MGIACAKALRLAPACLRSDLHSQLFSLAGTWDEAVGGGADMHGKPERKAAGAAEGALSARRYELDPASYRRILNNGAFSFYIENSGGAQAAQPIKC